LFLTPHLLPTSPLFPYTTLFRSRFSGAARLRHHRARLSRIHRRRRQTPAIGGCVSLSRCRADGSRKRQTAPRDVTLEFVRFTGRDRKSTRLNSSHDQISYAVFCL